MLKVEIENKEHAFKLKMEEWNNLLWQKETLQ